MSTVKTIGRKLLTPFLGRRRFQPFFEMLHEVTLAGLNMGEGASPFASGEIISIRHVRKTFAHLDTPVVVFDVGANIGQFSQVLLQEFTRYSTNLEAWLFEPSPNTFQKLQTNLASCTGIHFQNMGFGDQSAEMKLYSPGDESKIASLYPRDVDHLNEKMGHIEIVKIQTLDQFCAENDIPRIHFLKMDVEGHELRILQGAEGMLKEGAIDFIQFEFGGANVDSHTFFKDFYSLLMTDYHLYRILQDGLWPIKHYTESLEVFKRATNYLAQRKSLKLA